MKQLTSHLIPGLFALTLVMGGCAQQSSDQMSDDMTTDTMAHDGDGMSMDATVVAPDVYTVIHEDERVRILDMKLPAGVTDGMHSHPDEAAYFIEGSKVRIHLPDGGTLSHVSWKHRVENVGEKDVHAVIVELKE